MVGDDACARILAALETDAPDAIALRRTAASGRWINFHTDTGASRTVQVGSAIVPLIVRSTRDCCAGATDGRRRVRGRAAAVRVQRRAAGAREAARGQHHGA